MNRRKLLSLLPLIPVAVPTAKAENKQVDRLTYHGFDLVWTGWKTDSDTIQMHGQWIGHRLDGGLIRYREPQYDLPYTCVVSTTGGIVDLATDWRTFNRTVTGDWERITIRSSDDARERDLSKGPWTILSISSITI